jgi:hypothetical protein
MPSGCFWIRRRNLPGFRDYLEQIGFLTPTNFIIHLFQTVESFRPLHRFSKIKAVFICAILMGVNLSVLQ